MLKKGVDFNFNGPCVEAFEQIKRELTAYPVLRLYNPAAETQLHTDACSTGIGAVLLQKQSDGKWAPIAYFSQATNAAETKYHSFELEMLAIVKALQRFHPYLYGLKFVVVTDCKRISTRSQKSKFESADS